ncbi:DUF5719 family protein [Nocardioides donggukensis]|uniref:Secreted protein n=1 Tax=Nocardioides donggukensis TaxID=2774019 RepID=A0A927K2M7_9ACTN|nr:DUF5719 family protein [Nocardioides donggukensis]MBD8868732.1 hypothetical protein [Nocardioides donggukensis]
MTDTGRPEGPGRRVAAGPARRFSPALVVGLAAVLIAALALAVQAPAAPPVEEPVRAPGSEPLDSLSLACPAAAEGSTAPITLGSGADSSEVGDEGGGLSLRPADGGADDDPLEVDLVPRELRLVPGPEVPGAVVATGVDGLAPGLFGARFGGPSRTAAGECVVPESERWFAGAGAGGRHTSRLRLVNPDAGPAVADVTLWSTEGELTRVASRGLTVPGRDSTVIDLEEISPQRNELAMRVQVVRGRLAATVDDEYAADGGEASADWLAATAEPAESLLLPGLPRQAEEHTLTLLNPGTTEGRVSLQVVGRESTFAPAGTEEIRVPAGRVVVTDLSRPLAQALGGEDAALRVDGTVPVAAGLRSVVAGDLLHLPAVPLAAGSSAALVPPTGSRTLVLSGAPAAGRADVSFLGAGGAGEVGTKRLRLRPGVTTSVPLPREARAVLVDTEVPHAGAVRTVTGGGGSVLPLRSLVLEQLVPQVTPQWP